MQLPPSCRPARAWGSVCAATLRGLAFCSVQQVEGGESRTGSSLSLARARPPSEVPNGTSKSSSHAKGQRASSTYHRQRRHSDFCKWPVPLPTLGHRGPLLRVWCDPPQPLTGGSQAVPKTVHGILACRPPALLNHIITWERGSCVKLRLEGAWGPLAGRGLA